MRYITALILVVLTACSTTTTTTDDSVNRSLEASYQTVTAYVALVHRALATDRITVAQAEQASANAKAAKASLGQASAALAACRAVRPCYGYDLLMRGVSPALLSFEAELKKEKPITYDGPGAF